jgi:hypothetical protein
MNLAVGVASTPQIADINGDGMNDLVVGERTVMQTITGDASNLNYFQNIGSPGNAIFNPDLNAAPNTACYGRVLFDIVIGLPQYSAPAIVPTTDQLLMVIGSDLGNLEMYDDLKNGITGAVTKLDGAYGSLDFGNRSAPALADLNADGKYELIVGNQRGGLELFNTDILVGTTAVEDPVVTNEKPYTLLALSGNSWQVSWKDGKSGEVIVYDMQGRLLERFSSALSHTIDLRRYPAGMYVMQVVQEKQVFTEKVVSP